MKREGKKGGKKNKKSLSKVKKRNILRGKLAKQGLLNIDAKKKRRKEKKKEEKRASEERLRETERQDAAKEDENEITGQEMLEMMDNDDLQYLLHANSKAKGNRSIDAIENEGREYREFKIMKAKDGREIKQCLPIMTEEGIIQERLMLKSDDRRQDLALSKYKRTRGDAPENSQQDEDSGIGDADLSDEEFEGLGGYVEKQEGGEKSVAQLLAERQRHLHEQKVKMACLALNVIQDATKSNNIRFLLNMLKTLDPRADVTIYKYTMYTILQVFHDLIPGYRIQENTLQNKMKKETLMTAKRELEFIEFYKCFLKALEIILEGWKEDPTNKGLTVVSETAIFCLGDLVVRHPFFNYTLNIIQALVPHLNNKHDKIRKLVFDALSHTIKHDKHFHLTLEIVQRVFKMTHRLRFRVKEEVLKVFLALRGSDMRNNDQVLMQKRENTNAITHKEKLIKKLTENFKQKTSRKQKKEKKKMAKITKQMEGINMAEMKNIENTRHSQVIEIVFGLYIHVLKRRANSKLMSVVLEGLAKFAHLVNIEFFSDLLALMNQFLEDGTLGRRESLHCIQTVFTILSGQGETLNVDPHRFYKQFYRILMELNRGERERNIEIVLDILEQMLLQRRKKVSAAKVLSFAKRVATLCLALPHQIAIPALVKLKKLFSIFSVTEALLDPDPEGCSGMFLPEIPDPEHANANATAVWELIVCQRSYHPNVALLAKNILSAVPSREVPAVHSLIERSTHRLLNDFDQSNLKFNPDLPEPTTHLKSVKRKSSKRFFQDGELDLDDLKLQRICENILKEEDKKDNGRGVHTNEAKEGNEGRASNIKENPRKKLKSCHKESESILNFHDNIFNSRVSPEDCPRLEKFTKKNCTDTSLDTQ